MSLTALLSVSDKTGIVDFAKSLHDRGVKLLSTGGTAKLLAETGLPVPEVSEITGFPEMLDGRVKTLHPAVHGGLLARRDVPEHMAALEEHDIPPIDLVAVNLYPFRETFESVWTIVDPADYRRVLAALKAGDNDVDLRRLLAGKVYAHTAAYDAAI